MLFPYSFLKCVLKKPLKVIRGVFYLLAHYSMEIKEVDGGGLYGVFSGLLNVVWSQGSWNTTGSVATEDMPRKPLTPDAVIYPISRVCMKCFYHAPLAYRRDWGLG